MNLASAIGSIRGRCSAVLILDTTLAGSGKMNVDIVIRNKPALVRLVLPNVITLNDSK